ncbi:[Fe-Fe] hydrogenase large subunit C-terminal domain-containing protein [Caldanaerobius polysaccharolyticus]|uniref:[Fe-Fe] hydrogenase large subunit C-terminal domain-containing protein n=1 Tax=Caldanaerobius polysaccharolyticus TaxID=44256 RepID=UPI00047B504F|nr:[Fe-Fe] hydrogenase large subunit C-terminal domain-containing protein [Caldanaerobius polysaccharolyticus]
MPYTHSVTLNKSRCMGCTNCIKRCPTEAIRVRDGKAFILQEKCIDCGECIRVCPYHAKEAVTDTMDVINGYRYKIALPAPTFYSQYKNYSVDRILGALIAIGFDEVFEVAAAAEIVSFYTARILKSEKVKKPVISSACPVVVRLIQIRFPSLIDNILKLESPMEVAAKVAKKLATKKTGLKEEDIGVFFISPCAAKVTSVKNPLGISKSYVNGVLSMQDVYSHTLDVIDRVEDGRQRFSGDVGVGWAVSGGEAYGTGTENCISVDGVQNCIKALEEIEMGKMNDIDFFEGLACTGGCVGGPLTVENCFIAKNRIKRLSGSKRGSPFLKDLLGYIDQEEIKLDKKIEKKDVMKLDSDLFEALRKMEEIDRIYKELPGLDCGSCGAPNCRALAEDIVMGHASEVDCIFKLRERVSELAKEVLDLSVKLPPVIKRGDEEDK